MRRWHNWISGLGMMIAGVCVSAASGCKSSDVLPDVTSFSVRSQAIPPGASPVFRWQGSRNDLSTYWAKQEVTVEATAFLPEGYKDAKDGQWEASARNAEGKPIPFIGIFRRYTGENGTQLTEIVPQVDLDKLRDCLYLVIDPNVTMDGSAIRSIQPVALICEVRQHMFKPFRVKVPLIPQQESPLTPKPVIPDAPAGTPFPAN